MHHLCKAKYLESLMCDSESQASYSKLDVALCNLSATKGLHFLILIQWPNKEGKIYDSVYAEDNSDTKS
jgi:hypothetical protein